MAIYRRLREASFGPDEIGQMTAAYEEALRILGLIDRNDPITEILAKKIIEIARTGERNPSHICTMAIHALGWNTDQSS
jgi:hypothetical protein